ncbi:MAG: carboxypeptidase-like regulatory domain-containing protein [Myxococcota bacterium]
MTGWFAFGLIGCMADNALFDSAPPSSPALTPREVALTIEVLPTQLRESYDVDAPYRALPQSFPQAPIEDDREAVGVGRLQLTSPVFLEGTVTGFAVNPLVAELPGDEVPASALVQLMRPGTIQSYVVATDEDDGRFGLWAVPGAGYRLQVVPDDPVLPFLSGVFDVLDPPPDADVELGAGAPIYGRVTEGGVPLVGARVHVVDEYGLSGAVALTDELGVYVLRVSPGGTWTVVCDGRDNGRDPTLSFPVEGLDEDGRMLDIDYPPIANAQIGGGVDESDGGPARDATVRLVAESLDGFDGLDVSWSTEVRVNSDGFFYSAVLPGRYTVEVLPSEGRGRSHTPLRLEGVPAFEAFTELPTVQLEPLVEVTGQVTQAGEGGIGSAHVLCREIGFGARAFEVFTNPGGQFAFDVANVPLTCETSPPSDRAALASTRFSVDPSGIEGPIPVELRMGEIVYGEVVLDGEPEPFAVVEVRDAGRRLLGTALTTDNGSFSIRVDLTSAL